jgi:hypothetical protein
MLHQRNIFLSFWGEVIQTATYALNRTYNRLHPSSTPYEQWFGQKPSMAHMRIFGCEAYIHVPKAKLMKLESKTHPGMFLGYLDESKAYHIWDKVTKRVSVTRDVIFHENTTSPISTSSTPTYTTLQLSSPEPPPSNAPVVQVSQAVSQAPPVPASASTHEASDAATEAADVASQAPQQPPSMTIPPNNPRPQRNRK